MEEDIKKLIKEEKLTNFTFIPPQKHADIPKFLSIADICLTHLRKNYLYKITIPGKIYEYMAAAKPVIAGLEGEAAEVIKKANCGLVVEPENPQKIADAILKLYHKNKDQLEVLGKNGRAYLTANYSKNKMLTKCVNFIEK